ncbi:MAG: glycosyltransferase [Siculibacillus sp.]|nr:glycosyltransferase [Siculibacillus sp.]
MRIVHCVRAPIGGIFRHVVDLATAQTEAGHSVGIVCDSLTGGDFEAEMIARVAPTLAFGIARFPMRRALSPADLASTRRLWRHIAALEPDVLHGHGSKGGSFARLIGTALGWFGHHRPARIYCPHGGSLHFDAASLEGKFYFALERVLERMTDGLVFVSDYERRSYEAKIGRPKVASVLAHNGLTAGEFEPITPDPDAVDFLYIGMLRALKGTDVFIRAISDLGRRGVAIRALIVGIGDERIAYEELVRDLGLSDRVTFHDPMPIREALPLARAVVLPSRAESLPYVVLETLAAGVPLIATRVGGIPEIYDGHVEHLVPPGDAGALADAMRALIDAPEQGVALAAEMRRSLAERFTVETMMGTIGAFYARLTGPSDARGTSAAALVGRDVDTLVLREPSQ